MESRATGELAQATTAGPGAGTLPAAPASAPPNPPEPATAVQTNGADAAHMFSNARKKWIVATVAFAGFLGPIATTAYYPSLPQIARELNTTQELLALSVTVFTLGLAFFPLFWSSFSDTLRVPSRTFTNGSNEDVPWACTTWAL